MSAEQSIPCWIYRSSKKDEMYLYTASEEGINEMPEELMKMFGRADFVMELELHEGRPLARADVTAVMAALKDQGFFLQMPPKLEPELYHGNED